MTQKGGVTGPQALQIARAELIEELNKLTWDQLVQLAEDTGKELSGEPHEPYLLAMKAALSKALHDKTVGKRNRPEEAAPPARTTRVKASPEAAAGNVVPDPGNPLAVAGTAPLASA